MLTLLLDSYIFGKVNRIVVGLTGPTAGGKGTAAEFLKKVGYSYYSLSDMIRKELKDRGVAETKEALQNVGDELRKLFGRDVLARRIAETINSDGADRIVIDGIRHPSEIEFLRSTLGAKIVGVTASQKTRFEYMTARKRKGDPETFEEFKHVDDREILNGNGKNEHVIQVRKCLDMADVVIFNETTKEQFILNLERNLQNLGIEIPRIKKEREQ